MSRGFGFMQRYLLGVVGKEPMTFKQILDIAVPAGTFDGDMARALGTSSVSATRSLRRALFKLCQLDVLQKLDIKAPHSYRLHPDFHGHEFDPERIAISWRCREA